MWAAIWKSVSCSIFFFLSYSLGVQNFSPDPNITQIKISSGTMPSASFLVNDSLEPILNFHFFPIRSLDTFLLCV